MASRLPAFTSALACSARPALVSVRAARAVPAFRHLGAFAPTQSRKPTSRTPTARPGRRAPTRIELISISMLTALKKRAAVVEDAFEEDDFDDFEQSTQTDDIPSDTPRPAGHNREAHFQHAKAHLEAALNQSHVSHPRTKRRRPSHPACCAKLERPRPARPTGTSSPSLSGQPR